MCVYSVDVHVNVYFVTVVCACVQVMKMWCWVFPLAFLLSSVHQAEAQGKLTPLPTVKQLSILSYYASALILSTCIIILAYSSPRLPELRYRDSLMHLSSGRCNNVGPADIVFLIDGSSSIGRANFLQVKGFMAGIVKPFTSSVGQSGIRFGAVQYSDTSRSDTESFVCYVCF